MIEVTTSDDELLVKDFNQLDSWDKISLNFDAFNRLISVSPFKKYS